MQLPSFDNLTAYQVYFLFVSSFCSPWPEVAGFRFWLIPRPGRPGCRLHRAPAGLGGGGAGAAEPDGPPAPRVGDVPASGRRAGAGARGTVWLR